MKHLIILAVLALFLGSCSQQNKYISNEGLVYGTIYHMTYESPGGKDLKADIEALLDTLGNSVSTFVPTATISKINKNEPTKLDPDFIKVFKKAEDVSKITDGAFDVTVAPLVNAWGFGFKNKENITPELIDSLKQFVGYQKVRIEDGKFIKDNPGTMLDFSAIAKGYACDKVGQFLQQQGCKNFMVEIGGEVVAQGINKEGDFWNIGISEPDDNELVSNQKLNAIVHLKDMALATSGNYRNYYIKDGVKYAHEINPKTGYPVQTSVLSTTVLAKDCMTADAFATAFMVCGLEKAIAIADADKDIEVYFIYSGKDGKYQEYISPGFKSLLIKQFDQ